MFRTILLLLGLLGMSLLTGCSENNNTSKAVQENEIIDYNNFVEEICINNVVYYRRKGGGSYAALSPKIKLSPYNKLYGVSC